VFVSSETLPVLPERLMTSLNLVGQSLRVKKILQKFRNRCFPAETAIASGFICDVGA
jgi:hypothetical protein